MVAFKVVNSAIPAAAAILLLLSAPRPVCKRLSVTVFVAEVTRLPNASRTVTWTFGLIVAPAVTFAGGFLVNARTAALAGTTVTVAGWLIETLLMTAEIVFSSATVEVRVTLNWPLPSVVPTTGDVGVLPDPVIVTVRGRPVVIGLPLASSAVTVIWEAVRPAGLHPLAHAVSIVGEATTVDLLAETPPGWTLKLFDVPGVTLVAEAVRV